MNNRNGMNTCCDPHAIDDPLRGMPLGIGYVPMQEWGETYSPDKGLFQGTIFPPLDLPFCGCVPKGFCYRKGGIS